MGEKVTQHLLLRWKGSGCMGTVVLIRMAALAVARLGHTSRAFFSGGLSCLPRRRVRLSWFSLVMLLAVSGCGGTSSHARTVAQHKVVAESRHASGRATMLTGMTDERKIRTREEATAAAERARPIEVEIQREIGRLHREVVRRTDLSERERADKNREIDRLRKEWKRIREPIEAWSKQVSKNSGFQHVVQLLQTKDPEIERMIGEMRGILERKGGDEQKEIRRVQEEADRRLKELASKSR
jgi:hypothetical protein